MCYSHSWKSTRPMEDNHGQGSSGKHGGVDKERNGDSVSLQTEGRKVGRKGGKEGRFSFFELSWDFLWPYNPHDWAVCSSSAKHMPPCLCGPWRFLTSEKPIFHCCRNLSAPPLATLPTDWQQFHPPEITALHQGGPVTSLYGGSFSPQQCPIPTLFTWRYKASYPLPPSMPKLQRLAACPVLGQAELTYVSLLGTGRSGGCELSTHAYRLLQPHCSGGLWPGSTGFRVCWGLGHTVDYNPKSLQFYDSEVNTASH